MEEINKKSSVPFMPKSYLNIKSMPIAVCVSDLHLSLKAPVCRKEKDWLEVQARYLGALKTLSRTALPSEVPVLCAGDIFDQWNTPPELINFALEHLPDVMVCIPGQHDLPNHQMSQKERSGYGVLTKAKKIVDISDEITDYFLTPQLHCVVRGFGWEQKIIPIDMMAEGTKKIAMIHRYCWEGKSKFPGAPSSANLASFQDSLSDYDVAIFGDNHKGFISKIGKTKVINCGTFIRRKIDELNYRPMAGVLYEDGTLIPHYFDQTRDEFRDQIVIDGELPIDVKSFAAELEKLGDEGLDFKGTVKQYLLQGDYSEEVRKKVLHSLGL